MQMIRSWEKKKSWLTISLAEIGHAYNATWSTVTGYSPHYLMFRHRPRLLVKFVFPTIGSNEAPIKEASTKHMDVYIASVQDRLRTTLQEAEAQSTAEACRQKWYYDRNIGAVNLKPGNLLLVKADTWKGKRKIKDRWEEETLEVVHQIATDIPSYKVTSSHCIRDWYSLVYGQPSYMGQVYQPHPMQDYLFKRLKGRGCHKRKVVRQSPNDLPVKLPWGGKMGNCSFCHGCLPEHPLRMGEDLR